MRIVIKNMVCNHCVMAVRNMLTSQNVPFQEVQIGFAEIDSINEATLINVRNGLKELGFELVDDSESQLVVRIKSALIKMLRSENIADTKFSDLLSEQLGIDYSHISRTFTSKEGRTLEKYFIALKIERVKELLEYNELNIKEIAFQMGYSSTAHLSRQFKQVTGLSPSQYKDIRTNIRQPLDKI